jgi:NAD(P)H dehydrogenase (quinone)
VKKIFLLYGHYNDKSFNAAIKETFIKTAEKKGNKVDVVDLYKEKFDPVFSGEEPGEDVLNHRKRIEGCDIIVLIAPIWNFRMPAIVEGWIDKVLAPPWAFTFKQLWGNYGYPIGNLKKKKSNYILYIRFTTFSCYNFFFKPTNKKIKKRCFSYVWYLQYSLQEIFCSSFC